MLTTMKHCEELERRAQETVATENALKTVLRQVEMSVRKESEPMEPGRQPRPTPNRGTPCALPVHIEHNVHREVNFANSENDGGDCDTGRFASPRSSSAAATASPLEGNNHARGSTGQGASAFAESEPGGTPQEPEECATGSNTRAYVRLKELNPQELEQHAAEKRAKKARDHRDKRAAKRQRTEASTPLTTVPVAQAGVSPISLAPQAHAATGAWLLGVLMHTNGAQVAAALAKSDSTEVLTD